MRLSRLSLSLEECAKRYRDELEEVRQKISYENLLASNGNNEFEQRYAHLHDEFRSVHRALSYAVLGPLDAIIAMGQQEEAGEASAKLEALGESAKAAIQHLTYYSALCLGDSELDEIDGNALMNDVVEVIHDTKDTRGIRIKVGPMPMIHGRYDHLHELFRPFAEQCGEIPHQAGPGNQCRLY